jgi:catechol 2,3-dioxygenase-like lactoylglutathione lyase family enzyme
MPVLAESPVYPILLATDMPATKAFYGETLGLELVSERPDRLVFRSGDGTRVILSHSTIGTSDSQTQVTWRVSDIHAAVAELRARGVRIEEYSAPDPETVDGVADMGHSWAAWFVDPNRNVLSVTQPKG